MLDLPGQHMVKPPLFTLAPHPRHEAIKPSKVPALGRDWATVLARPGRLHEVVVEKYVPRVVTELPQIARVEVGHTEQAFHARPHLLLVAGAREAGSFGIKRVEEWKIVRIYDQD